MRALRVGEQLADKNRQLLAAGTTRQVEIEEAPQLKTAGRVGF
jgi:hypothetical protein